METMSMNDTAGNLSNSSNIVGPGTSERTVAAMALPGFMFSVGVVGNIIAIAALSGSKQERKSSAFYALVRGLAVTDLLGTLLASPITIATYLDADVLDNRHLCEFHSFVLLFFGLAGLSIICAMSAERYVALSWPWTYQRWGVDQGFARRGLGLIYISGVLFCCLPVMGLARSLSQPSRTWCFIDWRTRHLLPAMYSFLYGSVSLLLILMTIVLNLAVCGTLLLMRQRRTPVRTPVRAALSSGAETQMMAVLVVTSVVVLGCSAPLVVRVFANQIEALGESSRADLYAIRIASANPILDPWIYILLRRTLFRKILRLCKRVCHSREAASRPRTYSLPEDIRTTHVFAHLAVNINSHLLPATVSHLTQEAPSATGPHVCDTV